MIQESVNQLLTTAGLAARLSPEIERRRELRSTSKREELLNKQLDTAMDESAKYSASKPLGDETIGAEPELAKNIADVYGSQFQNYKKQFELNPTAEGYEKMSDARVQSRFFNKQSAMLEKKREEALAAMSEKASVSLNQDADFKKISNFILGSKEA